MMNAGPLGQIATLVVAAGGALVALWVLAVLWQMVGALVAMGWPLLLLAPAVLAGGALSYRMPGLPRLGYPPVASFCDECGNRLQAGRCPYCGG